MTDDGRQHTSVQDISLLVRRNVVIIIGAIVLSFLVATVLDVLVPKGFGIGFLYIVPIILSQYLRNRNVTIAIALLSIPAISLGFFISPPGDEAASIFNRATSLFLVLITTYFVIIRIKYEQLIFDYGKRAEEGRQYLLGVIDTAPIPLLVYDVKGTPMISNPPAQALWKGRPPQPSVEIAGEMYRSGTKERVGPENYAISRLLQGASISDEQVDIFFQMGAKRPSSYPPHRSGEEMITCGAGSWPI